MIIMIIILSVIGASAVIAIGAFTLGKLVLDAEICEIVAAASGVICGCAVIAAIASGMHCIGINQSSTILAKEYELKETFNKYHWDKEILESYHSISENDKTSLTSDITLETISTERYYRMVNEYNDKVYNFKCEVVKNKLERDNPWLSWFVSPAYQCITDEMLDQLTYTIGK